MKLITITTDFGVQSQGVGIMEAISLSIAPDTRVVHLMHGLPSYDITAAARTMETINYIPVGCHVCVCDPGVGSNRKPIVIEVKRGDYLIGPDNGVLLPAARILGGIERVYEIKNQLYMRETVSPIFHGRDIFMPIAAHLSNGVNLDEIGMQLNKKDLVRAPYSEAQILNGKVLASVIQINKFGSVHLNILHKNWDKLQVKLNQKILVKTKGIAPLLIPFCEKFSDVKLGENLILKDDYGRIEIASNQNSFAYKYRLSIRSNIHLSVTIDLDN